MNGISPYSAIRLSVEVGLWAVVLGAPVAICCGWLLARRSFRGKTLFTSILLAPMVLPPVATGLILLELFGRKSFIGELFARAGFPLTFTLAAAVLAGMVVGIPLFVLAARNAFEAVDPRYEELSYTLGHPPLRTFRTVSLPLALPGLAAGAILVFARALGEFGATAIVAGNIEGRTRTVSLAIYSLLESPSGEHDAWFLVAVGVAVSAGAVAVYEMLMKKHRSRMEVQ